MARQSKFQSKELSDEKYQRFAEQFVDLIVDPKQNWLVEYIVKGGLDYIPTDEEFESGEFAFRVLKRLRRPETELVEVGFHEALATGDRETLLPHTKQWAIDALLSDEQMRMYLKMARSSSLRQSYKKLNSEFKFHRGPKPKLAASDYHKALQRADQLRPAVEKVLAELASSTTHSLLEILEYCKKDYPEACEFLVRHLQQFQQALNDKRILNRAARRPSARARLLADAIAGTVHNLAFSTSIERVREARRSLRPKDSL